VRRIFNEAKGEGHQTLSSSTRMKTVVLYTGIFTTIATVIALVVQIWILNRQTNLIENQNRISDTQNQLMESQKRSATIVLLDNIMKSIDDEIKGPDDMLSTRLVARIGALSQTLRPHYSMTKNGLESRQFSYERGDLFRFIFTADNLGKVNSHRIGQVSDFSFMKIQEAILVDLGSFKVKYEKVVDLPLSLHINSASLSKVRITNCYLNAYCSNTLFDTLTIQNSRIILNAGSNKPTDLKIEGGNISDSEFVIHCKKLTLERLFITNVNTKNLNYCDSLNIPQVENFCPWNAPNKLNYADTVYFSQCYIKRLGLKSFASEQYTAVFDKSYIESLTHTDGKLAYLIVRNCVIDSSDFWQKSNISSYLLDSTLVRRDVFERLTNGVYNFRVGSKFSELPYSPRITQTPTKEIINTIFSRMRPNEYSYDQAFIERVEKEIIKNFVFVVHDSGELKGLGGKY
jgi:hypothetical protein